MRPPLTRVAVAQIDVHPAALVQERSPLEDPLFELGRGDGLLGEGGRVPAALRAEHAALRQRVREVYCRQLGMKLAAIVAACRAWKVRVLVLPEYSVPWELLPQLAAEAGNMVVVAGTHAVDGKARKAKVYRALGWPDDRAPKGGTAVAPVLFGGRIVALSAKLGQTQWEPDLTLGRAWAPVELEGFGPTFGVMICKDFLAREQASHRDLVGPSLEDARFLAVPSFTPPRSTEEFFHKALEEARRYGRPVLYADVASGGGTSIFADAPAVGGQHAFPEAPGVLPAGDEGVIVADLDLDLAPVGRSTRYDDRKVVVAVAQASLVYRCHPEERAYAEWATEVAERLAQGGEDDDVDELREWIGERIEGLQSAGGLTGAKARGMRLHQLWSRLDNLTAHEQLARYTREVVLPEQALPLRHLRLALAAGAEKVLFEWARRPEAAELAVAAKRLRDAGKEVRFEDGTWSEEGRAAFEGVVRAVAGDAGEATEPEPIVEVRTREVVPTKVPLHVLRDLQLADGLALELARTPRELLARFSGKDAREGLGQAVYEAPDGKLWAGDLTQGEVGGKRSGYLAWPVDEHNRLEELHGLLVAEGNEQISVGVVRHEHAVEALLVITGDGHGSRMLHGSPSEWLQGNMAMLCSAIDTKCDGKTTPALLEEVEIVWRVEELRDRFEGARDLVALRRERLLAEVGGNFVGPNVDRDRRLFGDDAERLPDGDDALKQLEIWAHPTALVPGLILHGEFGSGKSTLLAEWAVRRWSEGRSVIIVPLLGVGNTDLRAMILASAALDDTPENRAALDLLVHRGLLTICLDGFDEMIRDLTFDGIEAQLRSLFAIGAQRSKIVVTSRSNYFRSQAELEAIADRVGRAVGFTHIMLMRVRPFSRPQVEELVSAIRPEAVVTTLAKIDRIYDLGDLSHRPLLLGMVVQTIDGLPEDARIGPAQIYEAYLDRWLEQSRYDELFSPDRKKAFSELLAYELWRSGAESCSWDELRCSVYVRLVPEAMPGNAPIEAAALEIRGGAFFVHEGDRFRFAHRSFLEFFLARALMRRLGSEDPTRFVGTRRLSPEVLQFVAELLRHEGGEAAEHPAFVALQRWLVQRAAASEAELRDSATAAANALRLLVGVPAHLARPQGWVPEGAGLQWVVLAGETLSGLTLPEAREVEMGRSNALSLVGARLEHANLARARFEHVDLRGAVLNDSMLCGASFRRVWFDQASLTRADLTGAEVDEGWLDYASLEKAKLQGSTWTHCSWRGVSLTDAEAGGWIAPEAPTDVASGLPRDMWVAIRPGTNCRVMALMWSTQGDRLASADYDRTVRIWESSSKTIFDRIDGHSSNIHALAWSAQGDRLASADSEGIRIWKPSSGTIVARLDGDSSFIHALAWSAQNDRLASAGSEGTVLILELSSKTLTRLDGHSGPIHALAWSAQGDRLASAGDDRTICIWEPSSKSLLTRLDGHSGPIHALAWSERGDRLASAGDDRTIFIWEPSSKSLLTRLDGHSGWVRALAWSAHGDRLASAGYDRTIRIWEPSSKTLLARLDGHSSTILALAWSAEDDRLASAGYDSTIRIWHGDRQLAQLSALGHAHLIATPGGAFVTSTPPPPLMLEVRTPNARVTLPPGSLARELHRPDLVSAALAHPTTPGPSALEIVAAANHWPIDPHWSADPRILSSPPRTQRPPAASTTDLLATPNPFRPNKSLDGLSPPPGRTSILRQLLDHTDEGGSAALLGPRRAGKTSLFAYLRHHPPGPLFHASLQRITDSSLTPELVATTLDPSLLSHPRPAHAFRDALRSATNPVILLDELGCLTRATFGLLGYLRELSEDVAAIVYAGTHGDFNALMDHASCVPGSSFGNNIYPLELGPLAADDAVAFLTTTAPANVPITRAAPWIVELTEGWPFYLQVMGYALVNEVREGRYGALNERRELGRLYEHAVLLGQDHVLRNRWAEIPADVQRIVLREATLPTIVTPRDLVPYLDLRSPERIRLGRLGIADSDRGWRIDRPFLEWIRRNASDLQTPGEGKS